MSQLSLDLRRLDDELCLRDERPLIGISGGINSAALLVYLGAELPPEERPREVCLFHADIAEHPPDVPAFTAACVRWARRVWGPRSVRFGRSKASVLDFFERDGWIPHPMFSPCTGHLKLEPMVAWVEGLPEPERPTVDLVGYVREERRRVKRMREKGTSLTGGAIRYPVAHLSNADCFRLVDEHIGWHPALYDIRRPDGRPAFKHANCLPCKNMDAKQLQMVELHFPEQMEAARAMAERLTEAKGTPIYWGRPSDYSGDACAVCSFD